jgi:hypothetical protein
MSLGTNNNNNSSTGGGSGAVKPKSSGLPSSSQMQQAIKTMHGEIQEVKTALIDLYLDVKVRPQEEVLTMNRIYVNLNCIAFEIR